MAYTDRRRFLHLAAGAVALPAMTRTARAQAWPARPVRILVGFAAGGSTDIVTRIIAQWLSERLGQQFVVENRAGASSNLAAEAAVRAAPDGYTLVALTSSNIVNTALYEKLPFNINRDLTMISGLVRSPLVVEVHPSMPVKTIPEFIAYAKANPGKVTMASFGAGSTAHITGELFKMTTGVDLLHVPYRGSGPMLTDLVGGQVQMSFDNLPASIEFIKTGKLRALAVTTAQPSPALPNVPTVAEFVPGFEASSIVGIAGPAKMPPEIVDKLNKEINAALADPSFMAKLTKLSAMALPGNAAEFKTLVTNEIDKWGKVIKSAKIKLD
jgi:tripartite-type tricarboxylate transporter receptor subunit TctC